jgi:regulator of replication initiation timing
MAVVVSMGRWTSDRMLKKTYFRLYGEAYTEAVAAINRYEDQALGTRLHDDATLDEQVRFLTLQVESLRAEVADLSAENRNLRENAGLKERVLSDATVVVPIDGRRRSKWELITDEQLKSVMTSCETQVDILRHLNVSATPINYARLSERAGALGLNVPKVWEKNRFASLSDEVVIQAIEASATQQEVLKSLELGTHPRQFARLEQRAAELGVGLPPRNERQLRRGA